jgi:uncharacterized protein (DUF2461 family)
MPDSKITEAVRQEIDKNGKTLKNIIDKIIKSKQFYLYEEAVKTSPRGYKKENPHIELIKLKHRIFEKQLKDKDLLKPDFEKTIIKQFKELTPFVEWLQESIFRGM